MSELKNALGQQAARARGEYVDAAKLQDWSTAHFYQGVAQGLLQASLTADKLKKPTPEATDAD